MNNLNDRKYILLVLKDLKYGDMTTKPISGRPYIT